MKLFTKEQQELLKGISFTMVEMPPVPIRLRIWELWPKIWQYFNGAFLMKKFIAFSLVLATLLSLSACTADTQQPSNTTEKSIMANTDNLTLEYIVNHTELTDADFEGIDFENFVQTFALTTDNLEEYYLPDLIKLYRAKQADIFTDYSEILASATGTLEATALSDIQVIVWELHDGNYNRYMVIDFEAAAVYYSEMDIIHSCRESNKVHDLTDEDCAFVAKALTESEIVQWGNSYIGTNDNAHGQFSWSIGFELTDGSCIAYNGRGNQNQDAPFSLIPLFSTLTDQFVESAA